MYYKKKRQAERTHITHKLTHSCQITRTHALDYLGGGVGDARAFVVGLPQVSPRSGGTGEHPAGGPGRAGVLGEGFPHLMGGGVVEGTMCDGEEGDSPRRRRRD